MFREPKPGFSEVMELIDSLRGKYVPVHEIEEELRKLYQQHRLQHIEDAIAQGESKKDAAKSDPWKGLYPYKMVEYRDDRGQFIEERDARRRNAKIWVWREVEPSMPSGKQSDTIKDQHSENYRFYQPTHPITHKPCRPPNITTLSY
jgi:adenine-specific DNA-methyltransferase